MTRKQSAKQMANVVEIVINALDKTKGGVNTSINNMKDLQRAASAMTTVLVAAGAGVAATLAGVTISGINSADAMGKAAERAQSAVEPFSKLAHAAKLNDVELPKLEVGFKGLNKTI